MCGKFRNGRLLLFVLLLGGSGFLVTLNRRTTPESSPLSSSRTPTGEADSPHPSAPAANDSKSRLTEADSARKALVDARDRRQSRKPPLAPKRTAVEILEDDSSVEFVDTPLSEALQTLKEQHGFNLWLDKQNLGQQQTLFSKTVSLTAEGVRLDWVLDRLLLPLNLEWIAEQDLIRVTTPVEAAKHLEVRAYDVLDLIQAGFDEEMLAGIIESCVYPESWTPSPDAETGLPKNSPAKLTPQDKGKKGPATESASASGHGRTRVANGVLIVWQTQRVHAQVVLLLDDLETILDDAEDDRRFDPQVVTVHHRRVARKSSRKLLP